MHKNVTEDFFNVKKYSNKHFSFELNIYQMILKKSIIVSKKVSSITVFNTDDNKKCLLSIIQDHVTQKTGVMAAENAALPSKESIILKSIKMY